MNFRHRPVCGLLFLGLSVAALVMATASSGRSEDAASQGDSDGSANAAARNAKASSTGLDAAELKRQRKEAAHRHRRIIMNNDGNDARTPPDEPRTRENFLSKRTAALAGTQVDAIFYCSGVFNLYHHRSQESEPRRHGDQNVVDWAWELGENGPDSLATMVDFGHKNNMEVFWSMRMNDTHDSGDDALLCQWKKDHPEYLMSQREDKAALVAGGKRWSAVNYEIPEVREKVFRILQDVASRYDVDGLELDFFRHPVYFKPQMFGQPVTQEQRDLLTELLRRVRAMADEIGAKRGRPMLIAIRVPDSVEYCSSVGLDIVRWMQDDLVDLMSVSCYFHLNPWRTCIELGHQYGVPVYPCLSEPRFNKSPESAKIRKANECYRGRALDAWNAGADGIYMFNYFNPKSILWKELGDRESLLTMDQFYPAGTMSIAGIKVWLAGGMKLMNEPVPLPEKSETLLPGERVTVPIFMAAPVQQKLSSQVKATIVILTDDLEKSRKITGKLNQEPLSGGAIRDKWLAFPIKSSSLHQGVNQLELEMPSDGSKVIVSDAVIEIHYPTGPSK